MQVHSAYPAPSSPVKELIFSEPSQGAIQLSPFYRQLEPYAQFVNYQKADKTPWSFRRNRPIDATRPENGLPLAEVLKAAEGSRFLGVGFVLSTETLLAVIDLDRCVVDGQLSTTAQMILTRFPQAYVEHSPSGNGLHLWLRLSEPYSGRNRKDHDLGIEVSFAHQYVTLTGNRLENSSATIGDVSLEDFETWVQSQFGDDIASLDEWPEPVTPNYDDGRVRDLLFDEKRNLYAKDTKALWEGDLSEYGGDHSVCDYHLVRHLTFFTQNFVQIDRLFRESALMRDKWDERRGDSTYGVDTILDAMAARGQSGKYYASDVRNGSRTASGSRNKTGRGGNEGNTADGFRAVPRSQWGNIPRPSWLIDQMLIAGKVNLLYGESSTFKSFTAFHMAVAIATGTPCFGFECLEPGAVFWIAAEGEDSLYPMVLAWERAHRNRVPIPDERLAQLPYRVNLSGEHDIEKTLNDIRDVFPTGTGVKLIVVDTLSRTFEGDQNSNDDGAAYIRQLERLSEATGAAILLIHHGSKYGKGPRGAYAFFADSTLVIQQVRTDDTLQAELMWEKSRGRKQPGPLKLFGESVQYGECHEDASLIFRPKSERIPVMERQRTALTRLQEAGREGLTYTGWLEVSGQSEATFKRARTELQNENFVFLKDDHYFCASY